MTRSTSDLKTGKNTKTLIPDQKVNNLKAKMDKELPRRKEHCEVKSEEESYQEVNNCEAKLDTEIPEGLKNCEGKPEQKNSNHRTEAGKEYREGEKEWEEKMRVVFRKQILRIYKDNIWNQAVKKPEPADICTSDKCKNSPGRVKNKMQHFEWPQAWKGKWRKEKENSGKKTKIKGSASHHFKMI